MLFSVFLLFRLVPSASISSSVSSESCLPCAFACCSMSAKRRTNLLQVFSAARSESTLTKRETFVTAKMRSPISSSTSPSPPIAARTSASSSSTCRARRKPSGQSKPTFAAFFWSFCARIRLGRLLETLSSVRGVGLLLFLLALEVVPVGKNLVGRADRHISEDMRMAEDQLFARCRPPHHPCRTRPFPSPSAHGTHDLKQHIASSSLRCSVSSSSIASQTS